MESPEDVSLVRLGGGHGRCRLRHGRGEPSSHASAWAFTGSAELSALAQEAYTGARRGELLSLRWADVDWKAPAIRVRGSVAIVGGERIEGTTKGGRERAINLDAGTVDVLRAPRRSQMADQALVGAGWVDTGHVFTTGRVSRSTPTR